MEAVQEKIAVPELRFKGFTESWNEFRMEKIFSHFRSGQGITSSQISESGAYPVYGGNGLRGFTSTFTHDGFFFLIGRQGALCGNINRAYGKAFISEHAVACQSNASSDTEFLAQRLDYYNLNRLSESSAQPGLSVAKLLRFKLHIPTLPEQEKIAGFLSAVDKKIAALQQKKEALTQYKKGVMQKLFAQEIRFKQANGNPYPNWEEKKLGEVCIKNSSTLSANTIEENTGDYKLYGASGFIKGVDFYNEESPYVSIVKDGAGVGRVLMCEGFSSVLGTLDIIRERIGNNLYFIYCLLEQVRMKKYITGSTIPHIYFKDYSKEKLQIPCLEEQEKIAGYLSALDKKIAATQAQLTHTQQFKKGLLQKMFV